jgi:O-methyltransferase
MLNKIKTALSKSGKSPRDELFLQIRKNTMCLKEALVSLFDISERVRDSKLDGDIVECGVCNGGTAALLGSVTKLDNRTLWLFDSFEGMPPTTELDGPDASKWVGKCVGSEESVLAALEAFKVPIEKTQICKGWFEETFQKKTPQKIAILHVDADWYSSVKLCLDTFYERVVDGGYIILDDFGCWEGCREAFYDFCAENNIKPLIERSGPYQAYWVKGETHKRTSHMT